MNLKELYEKLPNSTCKKDCFKCCTNMIQFTPNELKAMGGYEYNGVCSHLKEGKCTVYEHRPFVCRLYGTSEILKCDGCIPENILGEEETTDLVYEYVLLKKKEETEM